MIQEVSKPLFDPTISLGAVIQIASLIFVGVGIYTKLSERLAKVEAKVNLMYDWWRRETRRIAEEEN